MDVDPLAARVGNQTGHRPPSPGSHGMRADRDTLVCGSCPGGCSAPLPAPVTCIGFVFFQFWEPPPAPRQPLGSVRPNSFSIWRLGPLLLADKDTATLTKASYLRRSLLQIRDQTPHISDLEVGVQVNL